tara:strand:+ start:1244 stop:1699 length:456 start_codon:yes stop_codon:yes gene_type:complete
VFVKVKIDNLNEFSKFILSKTKIPERINRLKKKEMNIKNEVLILMWFIFFSEFNIFLLAIIFGLTNLSISDEVVLSNIYNLKNFIPDVKETMDPPIKVKNRKYNEIFFETSVVVNPELLILLITLIKISYMVRLSIVNNNIREKTKIRNNK